MLELEERRAVETTLRRFAERVERTLFADEGPDGDLFTVPSLLSEARDMGLVADPTPEAPSYELGVWGRECQSEGLERSLLTLSILGEVCAGFAASIHAQGLACLALDTQAHFPPGTPLAAVFTPHYGVPLSARLRTEGSGLRLEDTKDGCNLNGTGHFLLAAEVPKKLVCFAQHAAKPDWVSLVIDANGAEIALTEIVPTQRTGLRATRQYHLHCERVVVSKKEILNEGETARRSLEQVMACDWLGQAAVALGVARRSLRDSRAYTAQRYQGGRMIQEHASIQLLQGTSEYDVGTLAAILYQWADEPLSSIDSKTLLHWAVQARLAVAEHAHRAVTNCLQTLGGYGYMEDYRLEKRLRDVSTLKSLHGAPDQLKMFINELGREERG